MTIPEMNETFEELATIIREAGLQWLEEEVRADLSEGKLEVVAESELEEPRDGAPRRRGKKNGEEFLRAQEYSPEERLVALIEAIETTVVQASDFEMELIGALVGRDGVRAIVFADEQSSTQLRLDSGEAAVRHKAAGVLRTQLADLRAEVASR
jgi:hypothetical protein